MFLFGFGIVVIIDGAYLMSTVMIAIAIVLFIVWSRMWAKKSA